MKKYFGLIMLMIVLVLLAGCTLTPATNSTTTVPTTIPATETAATAAPVVVTSQPAAVTTTAVVPVVSVTIVETTAVMLNVTITAMPNVTMPEQTATVAPAVTKPVTTNVIHIVNGSFVPSATTLLPGTGVSWINGDNVTHSVKSTGASSGMFNSGDILPGGQFPYSFGATEGTYTFNDPKFPNMTGKIIIKAGPSVVGY